MDSKQLFRAYHSKYFLSNQLNEEGEVAQSEGEVKWVYCGVNEDFKTELVHQLINGFDATQFRLDFLNVCKELGFSFKT